MDFFVEEASKFDEQTCEDIPLLLEKYNYYKSIFSFNFENQIKSRSSALWTNVLETLQISRSICLMNLSQSEDFNFFDCPSYKEMFKCAFMQPLRIINHFKQTVSQSLMYAIQGIHDDHKKFAAKVNGYFHDDISLHTLFGLSTFPALYSFFYTQMMCMLGYDFLMDFIDNPDCEHLFEAMLTSFFDCAYPFWSNFFENLFLKFTRSNFKEKEVIDAIKSSLMDSNPNLTTYHTKILTNLFNISKYRCLTFLSASFSTNFNRYRTKIYIPNTIVEIITKIFQNFNEELYICIISQRYITKAIPDAINSQVLSKIPLVFSDRDVVVLLEILKEDNISRPLKQLVENSIALFRNGYCPFTFDIHSNIYRYQQPFATTNDKSLKSRYAKYRQNITEKGKDPISEIFESNETLPWVTEEFKVYALRYEISYLKAQTDYFSNYINICHQNEIIERYKQILLPIQQNAIASHTLLMLNIVEPKIKSPFNPCSFAMELKPYMSMINFNEYPFDLCLTDSVTGYLGKYIIEYALSYNKMINKMIACIKQFREDPLFKELHPPKRLINYASQLLLTVELEKTKSKATFSKIIEMLFRFIEMISGFEDDKTEKYFFWRCFLPNDYKSDEVTMMNMSRLFISIFKFRSFFENCTYIENVQDILSKYVKIENCILFPFASDSDLTSEIIQTMLLSQN